MPDLIQIKYWFPCGHIISTSVRSTRLQQWWVKAHQTYCQDCQDHRSAIRYEVKKTA